MHPYRTLSIITLVLVAIGGSIYAVRRGLDNEEQTIASSITQAKIPLAQAVITAEQHVKGKASRAEFEQNKSGLAYDVEVVSGTTVFDVKVDADNGLVITSVEGKADHDDND